MAYTFKQLYSRMMNRANQITQNGVQPDTAVEILKSALLQVFTVGSAIVENEFHTDEAITLTGISQDKSSIGTVALSSITNAYRFTGIVNKDLTQAYNLSESREELVRWVNDHEHANNGRGYFPMRKKGLLYVQQGAMVAGKENDLLLGVVKYPDTDFNVADCMASGTKASDIPDFLAPYVWTRGAVDLTIDVATKEQIGAAMQDLQGIVRGISDSISADRLMIEKAGRDTR